MKNKVQFVIMIIGVIGIFVLSYQFPKERFKWQDERQVKNVSEIDEEMVSFQKNNNLSLIEKLKIIYSDTNSYADKVSMNMSRDEVNELKEKGKSWLSELMGQGILVLDDNYTMSEVSKKLNMEVADSVKIVITYYLYFTDNEENAVTLMVDGDSGKVLGFYERRQDADMDMEGKAKKFVEYLGGNYMELSRFYYEYYYEDTYRLDFEIDGQLMYYYIGVNPYKPISYDFGISLTDWEHDGYRDVVRSYSYNMADD